MTLITISKDDISRLKMDDSMKVYRNKKDENHFILRYKKEKVSDFTKYGRYRSLVVDKNDYIVACSPFKSTKINTKDLEGLQLPEGGLQIEEMIEGTMINLFYDVFNEKWEMATRSNIGGRATYVQEPGVKTFREMFLEACLSCNLEFDDLPKKYSYSFVMQHPENLIINQHKTPALYCVEVYNIERLQEGGTLITILTDDEMLDIKALSCCKFTEHYSNNSDEEKPFTEWFKTEFHPWVRYKQFDFDRMSCMPGVVIKGDGGCRWKIRCSNYEYLKSLRGNQIKPKYQYLTLRKHKKITEYLKYFPLDADKYLSYKNEIASYVHNLWKSYVGCYVKKQKPVKDWPNEYRIHMFSLHKIFLKDRQTMTLTRVFEYFNSLHESQQMFVLNYKNRPKKAELEPKEETEVKEVVEEILDNIE